MLIGGRVFYMNRIFSKKNIRVAFFVALDVCTLVLASYLSLKLRFDFQQIPPFLKQNLCNYIFVDMVLLIIIYSCCKLYKSMWSFASIREIMYIGMANVLFAVTQCAYKYILNVIMPKSYYLIQLMLLIIFVSFFRFFL